MEPHSPPRQAYTDSLTRLLHWLVAHPWVYDQVQVIAGAHQTQRRLAAQVAALSDVTRVLDVGGGTGFYRSLWPPSSTYLSADLDIKKLQGFLRKYPGERVLLADAAAMPLETESVDVVLCICVSHHLSDRALNSFLAESKRVLKRDGVFLFIDALWAPTRWPGRLLWRFDRGACPRPAESLTHQIGQHFTIVSQEHYASWHRYLLLLGKNSVAPLPR